MRRRVAPPRRAGIIAGGALLSPMMMVDFYSSAFCGPCQATRRVLAEAARLVPEARITEYDVVAHEARAESAGIRSTPTLVVRDGGGAEVFRAEGAPTLDRMLRALALAV